MTVEIARTKESEMVVKREEKDKGLTCRVYARRVLLGGEMATTKFSRHINPEDDEAGFASTYRAEEPQKRICGRNGLSRVDKTASSGDGPSTCECL